MVHKDLLADLMDSSEGHQDTDSDEEPEERRRKEFSEAKLQLELLKAQQRVLRLVYTVFETTVSPGTAWVSATRAEAADALSSVPRHLFAEVPEFPSAWVSSTTPPQAGGVFLSY